MSRPTTLAMKESLLALTPTIWEYFLPPSPHPPTATDVCKFGYFCFNATNLLNPPLVTSF